MAKELAPLEELAAVQLNYRHIKVPIIGEDGNVFSIIGRVSRALRRARAPRKHIEIFQKQAMASESYDEALSVVMHWITPTCRCDCDDD